MLFHSWTFAVFLVVVLAAHRLAPLALKRWVLLGASYVFYGWWNPRYALLILASTVIDYAAARAIARADDLSRRRLFLTLSITSNLGILTVFKYYNFFAEALDQGLGWTLPLHELLLPVGVSFYTFQSMSYTIDVYRRRSPLARDFVDFALYVSFFPQLVAGPIVRAVEFLPQLEKPRPRDAARIRLGLKLFWFGLFKKIVLADNLARLVDAVHADPAGYGSADIWIASYAFAFQIYCDFSGYSDMAIGLAALLGFDFPENFHRPYCARNVSEFWRRWHISLSTWLRDYLYIPLGGSHGSRLGNLRNLMITMLLGGLWHGANWTFVIWGTLHGTYLVLHRLFRSGLQRYPRIQAVAESALLTPVFVLLTFHAWSLSMVFFRADSLAVARELFGRMAAFDGAPATAGGFMLLCGLLYLLQLTQERRDILAEFDRLPLAVRVATMVLGLWAMIVFTPREAVPFLYFQF